MKTTKPIPWISEFEDITSVKREIQKKMLNELAEQFLIKNKHFETVIESFNKVMDSLSKDEQKNVLIKINATKEITEAFDKIEAYQKDLDETKQQLVAAQKNNSNDKEKFENKIKSLNKKIGELEASTLKSSGSEFFIKDGQVKFGNPSFLDTNLGAGVYVGPGVAMGTGMTSGGFAYIGKFCDGCGAQENDPLRSSTIGLTFHNNRHNTCPSCKRSLCNNCWPKQDSLSVGAVARVTYGTSRNDKCPKCVKEGK